MHAVFTYLAYPWLAGLATTQAFYMLSLIGVPYAAFGGRALAYIMSLIACSLYGVVASVVLRVFGLEHSAQYTVGRAFQFCMRILTNIKVSIEDPYNYLGTVRPAVFVGPHQSELDILVLGAVFPKHCSVTAKASLKKMPVLGWFMALSGSVFIDRANSKSARGAMQGAAEEMKRRGQSVWMFPEGTRSYAEDAGLLPFKKGAFHLAVQAGVPIVPVVVANYADVFSMKRWVFNSGTVLIKGKSYNCLYESLRARG